MKGGTSTMAAGPWELRFKFDGRPCSPPPTAAPDISERPLRHKYAKQLIKRGADGRCDDWDERLIYINSVGRAINQSEFSSEPQGGEQRNSVVCFIFRGCVLRWTAWRRSESQKNKKNNLSSLCADFQNEVVSYAKMLSQYKVPIWQGFDQRC